MSVRKTIFLMSAILVVLTVLLYTTGCCFNMTNLFRKTPKETKANRQSDKMAESVDQDLVSLNTDFALKIFKELSNEDKNINVFISPISISLAAAMAYNGAKNLIEPLKNLGMVNAFNAEKADFSSIAPLMFISQIEHKAIIEVNEEGTVAAAASSMGMGATAVRPVEFIVNRPFILLIRDDRTGNILFMGKILEP